MKTTFTNALAVCLAVFFSMALVPTDAKLAAVRGNSEGRDDRVLKNPKIKMVSKESKTPKKPKKKKDDSKATETFANGFENRLFGNFNPGGDNATVEEGKRNSYTGSYSLHLRDGSASLSFTNPFAVSSCSTLKVEFWHKPRACKEGIDTLELQSADGDSGTDWVTQGFWSRGRSFVTNDVWHFESVEFAIPIDTSGVRIQFVSHSNDDRASVCVDDVTVSGGNLKLTSRGKIA
jgi:hypothetical protein